MTRPTGVGAGSHRHGIRRSASATLGTHSRHVLSLPSTVHLPRGGERHEHSTESAPRSGPPGSATTATADDRGRAQALHRVRDVPLLTARHGAGGAPRSRTTAARYCLRPCIRHAIRVAGESPLSSRARSTAEASSSARPSTSSCSRPESRQCDERAIAAQSPASRCSTEQGQQDGLLLGGLRVDGVGEVEAGQGERVPRAPRCRPPATGARRWRRRAACGRSGRSGRSSRRARARTAPAPLVGRPRGAGPARRRRARRRGGAAGRGRSGRRAGSASRCARPRRPAPRWPARRAAATRGGPVGAAPAGRPPHGRRWARGGRAARPCRGRRTGVTGEPGSGWSGGPRQRSCAHLVRRSCLRRSRRSYDGTAARMRAG